MDTGDPQEAEEPAEWGDLHMAVAEPEIEPAAAEGAKGRQPRAVADIMHGLAEKRDVPKKRRNRPDVLTMATIVYHFENMSKSKRKTAHHFDLSVEGDGKCLGMSKRRML